MVLRMGLAAAAVLWAMPAAGQSGPEKIGDWTIHSDRAEGRCWAARALADGGGVEIGPNPVRELSTHFLTVWSPRWPRFEGRVWIDIWVDREDEVPTSRHYGDFTFEDGVTGFYHLLYRETAQRMRRAGHVMVRVTEGVNIDERVVLGPDTARAMAAAEACFRRLTATGSGRRGFG